MLRGSEAAAPASPGRRRISDDYKEGSAEAGTELGTNGATVPSVEKRLIAASVQWAEEIVRKG